MVLILVLYFATPIAGLLAIWLGTWLELPERYSSVGRLLVVIGVLAILFWVTTFTAAMAVRWKNYKARRQAA